MTRVAGSVLSGIVIAGLVAVAGAPVARAQEAATTPPDLVSSYQTLADAILAVKKTETNLVRAILQAAHGHALGYLKAARASLKGNDAKGAQAAIESMAAAVGQMASEGDAAVGAVRKRLLEGGHHHNAEGEQKGTFEPGYVVVTRAAKQQLLDSAKALGALAKAPKADALEAEWTKVEAAFSGLMK
jgi:hypothetical protein